MRPKHGAGHQPRAAGVVVVEEPADQLAARRRARGSGCCSQSITCASRRDPQPAERERDAASSPRSPRYGGVSSGSAQFDFGGAMPFVRLPSFTAGLKCPAGPRRCTRASSATNPSTSISSLRASSSRVSASALVTSRMRYSSRSRCTTFWSKIWKAARRGCSMTSRAVLHVRVVAEVRALVDEPLAVDVHDEPERVRVLLEVVADLPVAVPRRVQVPLHGVTAAPVAPRLRADLERHADAVAGVVGRAAHARQLPVRAQVARAHLRVGLEAARRPSTTAPAVDRLECRPRSAPPRR